LLRWGQEGDRPRPLDWGQAQVLRQIDEELSGRPPEGKRWFVNNQGLTLAILPQAEPFLMGSPGHEPGRFTHEVLHRRHIGRSFAIGTKDVTVRQFQAFRQAHPEVFHTYTTKYSPDLEGPIITVTWYDAAQYCRWLSEQDPSIPKDQYCYPSVAEIKE